MIAAAEKLTGLPPIALKLAPMRQPEDIEPTIRRIADGPGAGLLVPSDPFSLAHRAAISAAATDFAIGADESIHSMEDIRRHHEHKAARGVSLKTIKLGGMRNTVAAGRLCAELKALELPLVGSRLVRDAPQWFPPLKV